MPIVDITGLDKATVLAALHNAATWSVRGGLKDLGRDMTVAEAEGIIVKRHALGPDQYRLDHICGRPIRLDITGDCFDPTLFDNQNGEGAAARAIATIPKPVPQSHADDSCERWENNDEDDDFENMIGGGPL